MKIIKTVWHNQLTKESLEALLQIKVDGPDLLKVTKYYCDKAVYLWWNQKERLVDHKGKTKI